MITQKRRKGKERERLLARKKTGKKAKVAKTKECERRGANNLKKGGHCSRKPPKKNPTRKVSEGKKKGTKRRATQGWEGGKTSWGFGGVQKTQEEDREKRGESSLPINPKNKAGTDGRIQKKHENPDFGSNKDSHA